MKMLIRLVVVCGVVALLGGVLLGNRAIMGLNIKYGSTISLYQYNRPTIVKTYDDVDVWYDLEMFYAIRIDTIGDDELARDIMRQLQAHIAYEDVIHKVRVLYCYSPMLPLRQISNDRLVNLMIAIVEGNMSIGYPILMGSY